MTTKFIELADAAVLKCKDLGVLPLDHVAGVHTMVLQSVGAVRHAINVPFHDSQARGKALLIQTGWDQFRGTAAYDEPGPYLHEELIFRLIRARVRLLGLDFGSSNTQELIANDIPVVENLSSLKSMPRWGARFFAVPARIQGESATVRAFAEITSSEVS
jgi:kynurenine formamidase